MFGRLNILLIILTASLFYQGCSYSQDTDDTYWKPRRLQLVETLKREGISDAKVLDAIAKVPRHLFVPERYRENSYANRPLPIGHSQTISQPYIVAYMSQELHLTPQDNVLEIGTGSGYHAAVMSSLCRFVYTIEIVEELGLTAKDRLDSLGYENVEVRIGDGYQGWVEHAPFDAVILTAAPPQIPQPLLDQLKIGGRLIAPVGINWQELVLVTRTEDGYMRQQLIPVRFVPMTGEAQDR